MHVCGIHIVDCDHISCSFSKQFFLEVFSTVKDIRSKRNEIEKLFSYFQLFQGKLKFRALTISTSYSFCGSKIVWFSILACKMKGIVSSTETIIFQINLIKWKPLNHKQLNWSAHECMVFDSIGWYPSNKCYTSQSVAKPLALKPFRINIKNRVNQITDRKR